jgi:hypothetical protein
MTELVGVLVSPDGQYEAFEGPGLDAALMDEVCLCMRG